MPLQLAHARGRRRAIRLSYVNAAFWSIGNGLTSSTLLYYLALDLGASGVSLSLILALPALVGLLRLSTPYLVRWCGSAKPVCVGMSVLSYLLLWIWVAQVPAPGKHGEHDLLTLLIAVVCVHQLLEYIAHAALYAWLADLVPVRIRGRFFGRRNMWQLATLIPTSLLGGYFAQWWSQTHIEADAQTRLLAYTIPIAIGAVMLLGSVVPLLLMPATKVGHQEPNSSRSPQNSGSRFWQLTIRPFTDPRFVPLLIYRGWFSLSNGITQAAQNIYPRSVLSLGVGDMAVMRTVMQLGQLGLSPIVGRWADRFGNRPVLQASQAIVAVSLLFFLFASDTSPALRWLILGGFVLWSAYAGINVCFYNLMLKLPPKGEERSPYVSAHEATGSITYAVSTVAGGYALDLLRGPEGSVYLPSGISPFAALFLVGFVLRMVGVLLLGWINEPGAWSWSALTSRSKQRAS